MVAAEENQPATLQKCQNRKRRSSVVEIETDQQFNKQLLARSGSLDTFVIAKASTQKGESAILAQACLFASLFSVVSSVHMWDMAID